MKQKKEKDNLLNQDSSEKNKKKQHPADIEKLINLIPKDKKKDAEEIISSISITQALFSGPLPPPSILSEYNNIIKNGAERMMKMTENQSGHRIEL